MLPHWQLDFNRRRGVAIMLTINKLIPQAQGLAPVLTKRAARVELDWDVRQKSRFDATDSTGRTLGVFLPRGTVVRGGDVLVGEDGSLIVVRAALQPLLLVTHCREHGTPFDLLRAAYHLGNRHVQLELGADQLKLEPDHVLADMLRQQLQLIVTEAHAAFEPEAGAYTTTGHTAPATAAPVHTDAHQHQHQHGHKHDPAPERLHDHAGDRLHEHPHAVPAERAPIVLHRKRPAPVHDHGPGHVHGPGCKHD